MAKPQESVVRSKRLVRTKAQKTAVSQHIAGKTQAIPAKYLGSAVKTRHTLARDAGGAG